MCKEFLNTSNERHAFLIGFAEGAMFFRKGMQMPVNYENPLEDEWHYYTIGRPIGLWVSTFVLLGGIFIILKLGGLI